ncbi:MAG TPA: murein L,D-transpeptidase catalytic domain family protein [Vicinamibacterales bacterium]|nr:murein L,D-transpeptidase catalytic domain family protein [Vicinamibacterales bacterium]
MFIKTSLSTRAATLVLTLAAAAVLTLGLSDRPAAATVESFVGDAVVTLVGETAELVRASGSIFEASAWQDATLGAIKPEVFAMALRAAATAVERGDVVDPATLTVIDFSQPSTNRRMWVYDLRTRALLFEDLVSHGRGSGRTMATSFSNEPESFRSSLGLYRTAETYIGKHGYSLRLDGLEPGINDRARERAIVMHAAEYVNAGAALAQGFLGRSLGCPALRPEISRPLIDAVKNGSLLFAYSPDAKWLKTSKYL